MTATLENLLESFERLSAAEKHEATVVLLGRVLGSATPELTDDCLVSIADQLFVELDERESDAGEHT